MMILRCTWESLTYDARATYLLLLLRGHPHLDDTMMHSRVTHSHGCPGSAKRPISIGTKVSGRRRRGCAGQGRGTPACNQKGMRTRERASTARARKASPTRTFSIQFVCWQCMQASRPRSRLCRALSSTEISFVTRACSLEVGLRLTASSEINTSLSSRRESGVQTLRSFTSPSSFEMCLVK